MEIIKQIHTEFGSTFFLNQHSGQDYTVVAIISPDKARFKVLTISSEKFNELKKQRDEGLVFSIDRQDCQDGDIIEGQLVDGLIVLNERTSSVGQEYFCSESTFKFELMALTIVLDKILQVPNLFTPFALPYGRLAEAYFNQKMLSHDTGCSFISVATGRKFEFSLDSKYANDEFIHNWVVTSSMGNYTDVWIAPVKDYICSSRDINEDSTLADLWDHWLVKQYATKLSITNAPDSWINQGYVHSITKYVDPILHYQEKK